MAHLDDAEGVAKERAAFEELVAQKDSELRELREFVQSVRARVF